MSGATSMNKPIKDLSKAAIRTFLAVKPLREATRSIVNNSSFISTESRFRMRNFMEAFSPEEVLNTELTSAGSSITIAYPNRSNLGIYASVFGGWNDHFAALYAVFLPQIKTIVEVGANVGMDTVPLAKQVARNQGAVYAFEPSSVFRGILQSNIERNQLENIHVHNFFVGATSDNEVTLFRNTTSATGVDYDSKSFPTVDTEKCKTVSLDDFSVKTQLPKVDFLKIDTDGYDEQVLQGAENLIKRDHPFLMVEFSGSLLEKVGSSIALLAGRMESLGYGPFFLLERDQPPTRFDSAAELSAALDRNHSIDVFAIHRARVDFK